MYFQHLKHQQTNFLFHSSSTFVFQLLPYSTSIMKCTFLLLVVFIVIGYCDYGNQYLQEKMSEIFSDKAACLTDISKLDDYLKHFDDKVEYCPDGNYNDAGTNCKSKDSLKQSILDMANKFIKVTVDSCVIIQQFDNDYYNTKDVEVQCKSTLISKDGCQV